MVKRPPGTTGTGLLPRSNRRRTVILGGASGPLAATIQTMMTGPVSWEDSKPSDPTKDNEGATEVATGAEVEVVEGRDEKHGRAVTDNAVGVTQASTTCDSTMALATEKHAVRSRLGELHRLLNNRKGGLSASTT